MSAKAMGTVFDLDLPAPKMLVLLAMADHADHDGRNIFPSVALIAWKCGYSERQTQRIIHALEKDGILERVTRVGKTSLFSIRFDNAKHKTPLTQLCHPCQNVTPDITMSPHPRHSYVTPTPDIAMSPEPSLEPSINQKDSVTDVTITKTEIQDDKPKTPLKEKKVRPPNPMFDAVAQHVFGIDPKEVTAEGGRIAKISHWLEGRYEGKGESKVGTISHPAKPEHVKLFADYWKQEHDGKLWLIEDFVRFVEGWRAWASTRKAAPPVTGPGPQLVQRMVPDGPDDLHEWFREKYLKVVTEEKSA